MKSSSNEKNHGTNLYGFLVSTCFFLLFLEFYLYVFYQQIHDEHINLLTYKFKNILIYKDLNVFYSKLFIFCVLLVISIGSKPKKKIVIHIGKQILIPVLAGVIFFFGSNFFYLLDPEHQDTNVSTFEIFYMIGSILGIILLHNGFNNISKIIKHKLGKDKFNKENESFEQPLEPVVNDYSLNLPMEFYYKRKIKKGWFNLTNVFRGTLVIGTPESGKSFSIIIPFIKNIIKKKFTAIIYDFKYPDLGKIAYYHYLVNKKLDKNYKHKFHVVNLDDVSYSRRVNPLHPKYIKTLAHAMETAEALVEAIDNKSEGNSQNPFFKQSAINFLAANIYFFAKYKEGKYSTLPHILAFMNKDYQEIFDLLYTNYELDSLLSPFKHAYENKVLKQLQGQIDSLKINLSRLHTKEAAWIFSGNDVDLNISNPKTPSIFIIANSEESRSVNSTTNSLLLNRLIKQINTKNNLPCGVVIDELPTIYLHKIQNLISTARSNKVAVMLGLQELPQLVESFGKQISDTITSVIGNIISGNARKKETLDWLEKLFGKVVQIKKGISINSDSTNISINEQMGELIPARTIADLNTGEIVAKLATSDKNNFSSHKPNNTYHCKIAIDLENIKKEEKKYVNLPMYYKFDSEEEKESKLRDNFKKINKEIDFIVENETAKLPN